METTLETSLKNPRFFGERIHLFRVNESEGQILCKKLRFQKTFRIIGFLVNVLNVLSCPKETPTTRVLRVFDATRYCFITLKNIR